MVVGYIRARVGPARAGPCIRLAGIGLFLAAAVGCADRPLEVAVHQPIDFPHRAHLAYYASGQHRTDGIAVHRDVVDLNDLPAELTDGRCAECHSEDADLRECAGCHVQIQADALRRQKDVRPCVGCHRGAWGGASAAIPDATACRVCHEGGVRLARSGGKDNPPVEGLNQEVPWVRINTMPPNVYFSHTAHVRFASLPCTQCHQDVRELKSPPTRVHAFTMIECLTCHVKNGARTDCLTCHK